MPDWPAGRLARLPTGRVAVAAGGPDGRLRGWPTDRGQIKELCDHAPAGVDDVIDDDIDCDIYGGDDDDHVTLITSVRRSSEADADSHVLIYGTKSGCVFGMSVRSRCKLFNMPYPAEVTQGSATTTTHRDVTGLRYLPGGRLLVVYERHGLAVMGFGVTAVQS
ncbi:hypothetical protein NP493_466g01002 [Ridgeia piscesae]|uniref:Uncharacterized protein n=1 Tax=Ridgeia piscesae TaxID=27915 RepID=A0AAD9KYB4_RIDPI|nr:hypothetical protein NP493_466g01002 [Ridgeia piscesae]